VLNEAAAQRSDPNTIGARDFLLAVLQTSLRDGDYYKRRPLTADLLLARAGGEPSDRLTDAPAARRLIEKLLSSHFSAEDFQYFVTLEENRIAFRAYSVVDDVVERGSTGILLPRRLLLTHFKERYACFTTDEIGELEELINSPRADERAFQSFFETHPHFLRRWDMREVYPHVYLTRDDLGPLVPDFLLTDRELQRATVLELKLPGPRLITRSHNRERFAVAVQEARAQLLTYRDWFRDKSNRERLRPQVGLTIYEPRLAVLIGRSSEFVDEFDRQRLVAASADIDVCTYDDLLVYARRRRFIVDGQSSIVCPD
jgi:hypothetical protein